MAFYECSMKGGKIKRTLVGSVTAQEASYTFDCTSIKGYEKLTAENFGIVPTSFYAKWVSDAGNSSKTVSSSMTYDAGTGVLTISGTGTNSPRSMFLSYEVFCYHT